MRKDEEYFEQAFNNNVLVYFSWKLFEFLTKTVIGGFYFKSLLILAKLPSKSRKTTTLLFLHALFMFIMISADLACTAFVILTESKDTGTFYRDIAIFYSIWRICDSIYIIFMLAVASQFTTYFIMRKNQQEEIRNA